MVWEMPFEEFQDGHHGGHLGYGNGTILAILNLHVATMPPTKNDFNNSESLCHCDASHQVSALSALRFERCRLKNFKMAIMAVILDMGTKQF